MPKGKFSKQFDYQPKLGARLTSYPKGYESDDIPQSHYEAAVAAGAIEGVDKPAAETPAGGTSKTGAASTNK